MFRIHPPHSHSAHTVLRRFVGHERAIAATEFALVLPFLLLLLMGIIEFSNIMTVERKLLNSMQTAADLIGQYTDVSDADLTEIYTAARLTMSPYDTTPMTIGIASVRFDATTGAPTANRPISTMTLPAHSQPLSASLCPARVPYSVPQP